MLLCMVFVSNFASSSWARGSDCPALRPRWSWEGFFSLLWQAVCNPGQQEVIHCHSPFITTIPCCLWSLRLAFIGSSNLIWNVQEGKCLLLLFVYHSGRSVQTVKRGNVIHPNSRTSLPQVMSQSQAVLGLPNGASTVQTSPKQCYHSGTQCGHTWSSCQYSTKACQATCPVHHSIKPCFLR